MQTTNIRERIPQEIEEPNYFKSYTQSADWGRTSGNQRDPRLQRAGFSLAERYLLNPQVSACFLITVFAVLNKVGQYEECDENFKAREIKRSKEIADFLNFSLDAYDGSHIQTKYDLMLSKWFGVSFVELVYSVVQSGKYKGFTYYQRLKGKRTGLWDFEYDDYGNVIGYKSSTLPGRIIPTNQMMRMSWLPLYNNPNGSPDFAKVEKYVKVLDEYLLFIVRRGTWESKGSQVIMQGPTDLASAANDPSIKANLAKLEKNLSAYIPNDWKIQFEKIDGKTLENYLKVMARMNIEIATAMLGNSLTTNQNENSGSYAMAEAQMESGTFSFTDYACRSIEEVFNEQYAKPLIAANFDINKYPPEIWPKYKLKDPEHVDKKLLSELMKALKEIGALDPDTEVDLRYLRRAFDLPENPELYEDRAAEREMEDQEEEYLDPDLEEQDSEQET